MKEKDEIKTFASSINAVELSGAEKTIFSRSNYFKFHHTETLIAIKISRSPKPFFGIGKKVVDYVNTQKDPFYLVLLISDTSGWCYSKKEVNSNIKNRFWRNQEGSSDYKINHGDLSNTNYFTSIDIFFNKIKQRDGLGNIRFSDEA
jgi:hypothetical protein